MGITHNLTSHETGPLTTSSGMEMVTSSHMFAGCEASGKSLHTAASWSLLYLTVRGAPGGGVGVDQNVVFIIEEYDHNVYIYPPLLYSPHNSLSCMKEMRRPCEFYIYQ